MKFGASSYEDVKNEPTGGGGGGFIKYLKAGDTTFRVLTKPSGWKAYWEHSNYGHGFPFPCTGERSTCPGCTSDLETRKSAGRKILIPVLEKAVDKDGNAKTDDDGKAIEYVNWYKFSREVADMIANRHERMVGRDENSSITDRELTITRFSTGPRPTDVGTDIESGDIDKIDLSKYEIRDHEELLQKAYDDVWGDDPKDTSKLASAAKEDEDKGKDPEPTASSTETASGSTGDVDPESELEAMRRKLKELEDEKAAKVKEEAPEGSKRAETGDENDPPFDPTPEGEPAKVDATPAADDDDVVYTPEQLRAMTKAQLLTLILKEQESGGLPQDDVKSMTKVELLDWLFKALGE